MSENNADEKLTSIISLLGHIEIFKTTFSDLNKTAHITFLLMNPLVLLLIITTLLY